VELKISRKKPPLSRRQEL